jgi:sphingomyelin phosphodiesterase
LLIGKNFENKLFVIYKHIDRYENTIAGQFYGHAHSEELMVFYDEIDKQRPVSMVRMSLSRLYA